ncbi:hypothetical protein AND_005351 [Anopheles darlingi]|uniref:Uncharacterized protein n=1 Tax=Anopheles darlingi TaxID=43151 RepID=W5JI37_ANODA|nr:hypothetical protein AND_005351 [Anopheles darlingi]
MYQKKLNKNTLWNSTYMLSYTGINPMAACPVPKKTEPYIPEHRQRYLDHMAIRPILEHRPFVRPDPYDPSLTAPEKTGFCSCCCMPC